MSFIPDINGVISTSNSTSTPLTSGSTFTGTSTDVLLYSTVAVSAFSDVSSDTNGFSIQFSSNGTNWDFVKTYTLIGNEIQNHIFPVTSRYFRVVFTNGSTNQISFRLQTILHPLKNKSITQTISDGIKYLSDDITVNNSVGNCINNVTGNTIKTISNDNENNLLVNLNSPESAFGDIRGEIPDPTTQVDFVYGINTDIVTPTVVGSGTVTSVSGVATISSGAAINSSATLVTKNYLKYRSGQGGLTRFTALFTTGVTGNTQIVGVGTSDDGFFFGYNETSFGILHRSSSTGSLVNTWIPQSNWNTDTLNGTSNNPSNMVLVQTNGNVYQIKYCFPFGNVFFYVMEPDNGKFILVHVIRYSNSNTSMIVRNPSFPLYWQSANTTNNTNIVLKSGSGAQFNEGIVGNFGGRYGLSNNKTSNTSLSNALTIRNNTTFNGITNRNNVIITYLSVGARATANAISAFYLTLNATLGGTPVFNNVDVNNSMVSYDIAGTSVTGGTNLNTICLDDKSTNTVDLSNSNIMLNPGDTLTLAVISSTSINLGVSINWVEDI